VPKDRNSVIELLRILAMLLIIAGHDVMASGLPLSVGGEDLSLVEKVNLALGRTLFSAGHWGAITFFLITGYFWRGDSVRWKAVGHIMLVTAFYLAIFPLLAFLLPGLLPEQAAYYPPFVLIYPYWFVTAYLLMMLVYPLLMRRGGERFLSCLTWGLGAVLLLLWALDLSGRSYAAFPPVYLILAPLFFLLLGRKLRESSALTPSLGAGLAWAVLSFLAMVAMNAIGGESVYRKIGTLISPLNILLPTFLLLSFLRLPAFHAAVINKVAALCLGIYLIHVNPYVNGLLWGNLFVKAGLAGAPVLFFRLLGEAMLIFVTCGILEGIRQRCMEKIYGN